MSDTAQTPLQEAVSVIVILSIFIAVGCYLGAINHVPLATPVLS